ncbi:MAG: hypothetical protein K2N51_05810 [Lachnospiraceae bacterium]|nr:hypothetical protein [Lachnospiraceae bacterium]
MADEIMDIPPKERRLLSVIRKRSPMFVGEFSLDKIECFLRGYKRALLDHDLDKEFCIIPEEFDDFVLRKYGLYPSSMGWCMAILQNIPDGKEAIEVFFDLLDEFLETNGFEKIHKI